MKKFVLKLDLKCVFEDERKLVLILVDPAWENVECLENRVKEIFDVAIKLLTPDNFLIPSEEPIEIVRFFDMLKAFVPNTAELKKGRKSKRDVAVATSAYLSATADALLSDNAKKKRKFHIMSNEFTSSTPNVKRSKNADNEVTTETNLSIEITSTSDKMPVKNMQFAEYEEHTDSKIVDTKSDKFRGKRKKKQKAVKKTNETAKHFEKTSISQASLSQNQQTNHVFYNESDERETTASPKDKVVSIEHLDKAEHTKPETVKVIFRSILNEIGCMSMPRVLQLQTPCINILKDNSKHSIDILEHVVLNLNGEQKENLFHAQSEKSEENHKIDIEKTLLLNDTVQQEQQMTQPKSIIKYTECDMSKSTEKSALNNESEALIKELNKNDDMVADISEMLDVTTETLPENESTYTETSEIIDLSDSSLEENPKNSKTGSAQFNIDEMLPLCKELTNLPSLGDIVVFKISMVDTNYIAGLCEYINKRTKSIKLKILSGLWNMPQKFICQLDCSADESPLINIKLSEMAEAKVYKSVET